MKLARTIFMVLAVLAVSAFLYADSAYQIGYEEGFRHGLNDKQAGVDFNYEHSYRFQQGISNNTYTNSQFREGYKDGYVEGYSEPGSGMRYSSDRNYNNRTYRSEGFVIAFKDEGFKGDIMQFPVGRYPDLDKLNWLDEIESIQIPSNVRVILFDDEDFKGQSLILEENSSDLDELNFKERAESMIVEPRY